jgi:hypothetical protein
MKKYFFLLMLIAGLISCTSAPPVADLPCTKEISLVQADHISTPAIIPDAPEVLYIGDIPEYRASILDLFGDNIDIVAVVLLLFTSIFGTLWIKLRSKIKSIGELFLKAYEYTDDKKLDPEEREDLKRRFLEILNKTPT